MVDNKEDYKTGLDLKNLSLMDNRLKRAIYNTNKASEEDKAYSLGVASGLLKKANEMETDNLRRFPSDPLENPVPALLFAAGIYSSVEGKLRDSVKRRMEKILEKNPKQASLYRSELKFYGFSVPKQTDLEEKEGVLEEKVRNYTIPLLAFILSLFFLTPSLTGNIIGNLPSNVSRNISIIFFIAGLVSFLFIKLKK
jgi:hypothetical protein